MGWLWHDMCAPIQAAAALGQGDRGQPVSSDQARQRGRHVARVTRPRALAAAPASHRRPGRTVGRVVRLLALMGLVTRE